MSSAVADDKTVHDAVSDNVEMVVFQPRHSFLSPFRNYARNCSGTSTSRQGAIRTVRAFHNVLSVSCEWQQPPLLLLQLSLKAGWLHPARSEANPERINYPHACSERRSACRRTTTPVRKWSIIPG